MHSILAVFVYALEGIFAIGIVGSLLVLILTSVEDGQMLFGGDKNQPKES